jgi:beta-lactam-binding protein with PASTA domain
MAGVVYMSLAGTEIKVPEIVGKDFIESEKELAALGLKIKKRADRPSSEKINTVLEQLPRAGETVKTGQLILVVVSKVMTEGDETPKSLIKDIESDDTEKIEEMIQDKPKKSKSNSNSERKKADTTRDVIANTAASNTDTAQPGDDSKSSDPSKKEPGITGPGDRNKVNPQTGPQMKPQASPPAEKPAGDTRSRSTQRNP